MGELVPVGLGLLVAALACRLTPRVRAIVFPIACVLLGALASAVNGELASEGWAFFVSVDSLLVWATATCSFSVLWWVRRPRAVS
jgi:hypothetical protein